MKDAVEREAGQLIEISTDEPQHAVRSLTGAGFAGATLHGQRIHVLTKCPETDHERVRRALSEAGLRVTHILPRALTLEDVFVYRVLAMEQPQREEVVA
jgi:ABC-2 type transport system ATP-binding protein